MRVVGRTKLLPSFSDDSHEGDESLDFDDDDDDDDDEEEDNVKRKPSGTLIAKASRLSATIFNPVTTNNNHECLSLCLCYCMCAAVGVVLHYRMGSVQTSQEEEKVFFIMCMDLLT